MALAFDNITFDITDINDVELEISLDNDVALTADEIDEALSFDGTDDVNVIYNGTKNYVELRNKPQINQVTLQGNVTPDELGIPGEPLSNIEIEELINSFI